MAYVPKQYTDDDIRNMKKVTTQVAADYLGITRMAVCCGMRYGKVPIGSAVKPEGQRIYSYHIVPERLIAYKHGTLIETQYQQLDEQMHKLIEQMQMLRADVNNPKI